MARFKVTPVNIKNGNTAPYSIHDIDENKNPEVEAASLVHLTKNYPNMWRPSVSKLNPCKANLNFNR